jgi:hypothetical protein
MYRRALFPGILYLEKAIPVVMESPTPIRVDVPVKISVFSSQVGKGFLNIIL